MATPARPGVPGFAPGSATPVGPPPGRARGGVAGPREGAPSTHRHPVAGHPSARRRAGRFLRAPARRGASARRATARVVAPDAVGPGAGAIGGGTIVLLSVHAKLPYGLMLGVAGDAEHEAVRQLRVHAQELSLIHI